LDYVFTITFFKVSAEPEVDASALEQLMGMGFSNLRSTKALIKTGNNGAEVAMNWLFEHMEDPDIDDPIASTETNSHSGPSDAELGPLTDMGFTIKQARKAMKETVRIKI
jgi:ubiquitin carboxyl-terminal hydrolase 5/13